MLWALWGCDAIDDLKEEVEGLTNPLVAQGFYLGVEAAKDPRIDPSVAGFSPGARFTVFLADASSADEIDQSPVTDAGVDFRSAANGTVALTETSDGRYVASSQDIDFDYAAEETTVRVAMDDEERSMSVLAPTAIDVGVPDKLKAGNSLSLSAQGLGIDNLLVVVFDAATGEVTFSNEPNTANDLYAFTSGNGNVEVEVPSDAFDKGPVFGVGFAGLTNGESDDIEGMNTALSGIMAGPMRFVPVVVD